MKWYTQWNHRLFIVALTVCFGVLGLWLPRPAAADTTPVPNGTSDNPDTISASPDGNWLAYRVARQDNPDTFDFLLLDLTDPTLTPRTINSVPLIADDNAQFSPSSRYLLHEQGPHLYLYDLTTQTDRQLTDGIVGNSYQFMPNEQYVIAMADPAITSIPLDGSPPVALIPPGLPGGRFPDVAISPDSRYVLSTYQAFTNTEEGFVVLAPITATGSIVLQDFGLGLYFNAQFSANAERAYFVRGHIGSKNDPYYSQLSYVDVATQQIGDTLYDGSGFAYLQSSPDHRYLFIPWQNRYSAETQIMRITAVDGAVQPLFATSRRVDFAYRVAPIGNRLMFMEYWGEPIQPDTLWSISYDPVRPAVQLYQTPSTDIDINNSATSLISPDGSTVAFKVNAGYLIYDLYTVPIDGSAPATKRLDIPINGYAFAPEGNAIWATPRRGTLYDIAYLPPNGDPLTIYRGESNPFDTAVGLESVLPNERLLYVRFTYFDDVATYYYGIADTVPAGTLTSGSDWLAEGASTSLNVTILPSSTVPVSFTLALTGSIDPADVQIEPLTLSIPPGETQAAFTFTHLVDKEEEPPLTATLELVPLEDAALGDTITVTLSFIDEAQITYLPLIRLFD